MKFSKIASIMKKTKTAILFTDADGMQWLSNGAAVYKLENMPPLDEDTVLTVMGVADDAKSKWHTATREDEKELLLDHVDDEEEITAEDAGICIVHNGKKLVPIYTCDGMLWLDVELLAPTEKKEMGYRKFFVRKMGGVPGDCCKRRFGFNGCHSGSECMERYRAFGLPEESPALLQS